MLLKQEKGLTGIDIAITVVILTIFVSLIANLINNVNISSKSMERKSEALSYAIEEIENIKSKGFLDSYIGQGIYSSYILTDRDITEGDSWEFTGYHKKVILEDYAYIKQDLTKKWDIVKKVTVEISYKLNNKEQKLELSTYITRE